MPAWRWHLGFDLLTALGIAVATATLGLVSTFALVFIPGWIAFRVAASWRSALAIAAAVAALGYLTAFALALALDQPFSPVLVALLLTLAAASAGATLGQKTH